MDVIGSQWIPSNYTRVQKANLSSVAYNMVLRIPRSVFRPCAITFADVRSSSEQARYRFITLQLFLEMLHRADQLVQKTPEKAKHYPFQKVYLEWVPSPNNPDKACEYRLHVFFTRVAGENLSIDESTVNIGEQLDRILQENNAAAEESANAAASKRRPDPLAGLRTHQQWKRVRLETYLKVICGLVRGDGAIGNALDEFLSNGSFLNMYDNAAHPKNVFTLNFCMRQTTRDVKDHFRSIKAYRLNNVYDFPDYSKVWRLTPDQFAPHNFLRKFLPDYQAWSEKMRPPKPMMYAVPNRVEDEEEEDMDIVSSSMVQVLDADQPLNDEVRFDATHFSEYDIRNEQEMEQARLDEFTTQGDFHVMVKLAKNHYKEHVAPHEGTPAWREAYQVYQAWCISETKARCFTPDSDVSPMIRRIAKWGEEHTPVSTTYFPVDPSLSPFANRVIRLLEQMEQYDLISTSHLHYYTLYHARYDAYRRAMDKVKSNVLYFGEGASGKSFMFKLLGADSIPGTVIELTYQTSKADAIDGNRNGEIVVMHEVPPSMFLSKTMGRNADKGEESRWKDKLTRQKVTVKTFYYDEETGKRMNRTAESECNGVWFGACNQTADDIEEALATRFLKVTCETTVRDNKDISDCQNAERRMDQITSDQRSFIRAQRREEQYRMCLIEHYIWMGAIKDVEESAYHVIIGQFKNEISKIRRDRNPRDFERIRILCRCQAICTAIDAVYNLPGGELYGQPFREEDLPILEPHLVITEEIVLFTLSLLSYMFVSKTEHKVFHTLYKMFRLGQKKHDQYLLNANGTNDHNYVFVGKLHSIIGEMHQKLPLKDGRVPEEELRAMFLSLSRRHIQSRGYEMTGTDPIPQERSNGRITSYPAAVSSREGIFVHWKFINQFKDKNVDPVREIIERMSHVHARTKKMLIARPVNHSYHVLHTFTRVANTHQLRERNVLHNTSSSRAILGLDQVPECRVNASYSYSKDLDDNAYEIRCRALQVAPIMPADIFQRVHVHNHATISYPGDLMANVPTSPVEEIIPPPVMRLTEPASAAPVRRRAVQTTIRMPEVGTKAHAVAKKRARAMEEAAVSKRPRTNAVEPGSHRSEIC